MWHMDGRRVKGKQTRQHVAAQAASLASVDGLCGLTIGQLAETLGMSKGTVQGAFPTKEAVQVAAVGAATEIFVREVVMPAQDQPEGLPRLLDLVENWLSYVERRVFPGGCFMVATLAEFDSRPGPVRDALAKARRGWLSLLESQAAAAQAAGDVPDNPPAADLAFEIDALLAMANISRNFSEEPRPLSLVRGLIEIRLGVATLSGHRG
jgi:AcrR family transcriptional regulator